MNTISVFRTIQVGFIIMLMIFITYCKRIKDVKSAINPNQSALILENDTLGFIQNKALK